MSSSRKINRNGGFKPPLSRLDKFIYLFLIIGSFFCIFIMLQYASAAERIAFSEEGVIASNNTAALLWSIPLSFFLSITIAIPASLGLKNKQPIFGNKKFKAHPFDSVIPTYPIFSKEFRENLTEKAKKKYKLTLSVLVVTFVICLSISFFGIYPRDVLRSDGSVASYSFTDQLKDERELEEIQNLEISVVRSRRRRQISYSYHIEITLVYDDKSYSFSQGSFSQLSFEDAPDIDVLSKMISLKKLAGNDKCVIDRSMLELLIDDRKFDHVEEALARELFE